LSRLTGERPIQGVTPDSLLALHDAGYRAVIERLGAGRLLDLGCGQGFESVRLAGPGRPVIGVDRSLEALRDARRLYPDAGRYPDASPDADRGLSPGRRPGRGGGGSAVPRPTLQVARSDALALCLGESTFDYACSSHLIEHFERPEGHVAEMQRVLRPKGSAFVLTPNEPADFENPFHVHLFSPPELEGMLARHFSDVWVGGLDATDAVKADFRARREKATKLLSLDFLDLRHRLPRSWYVAGYTRVLPVAYKLMARRDSGGTTGITADDFFVTDRIDETTLVLFAIAREPRK
jgi:SAM-dependent methyltransferase